MNRLDLFPDTTKIENDVLTIDGTSLTALANLYGTPLYVYDRATLDTAAEGYRSALASHYPGQASVTYAGKAFLNTAIAQWTQAHDLFIDCTGEGEIAMAQATVMPNDLKMIPVTPLVNVTGRNTAMIVSGTAHSE